MNHCHLSSALDQALALLESQIAYYQVQIQRDIPRDPPVIALPEQDLVSLLLGCLTLSLQCVRRSSPAVLAIRSLPISPTQVLMEVRGRGVRLREDLPRIWKALLPELAALEERAGSMSLLTPDGEDNVSRIVLPRVVGQSDVSAQRLRFLVVDDSPDMLDLYRTLLDERDYIVDYIQDGYQGLIRLRKSNYALVILDLAMPGVNGALILSAISRELPERLPHLLISSGCLQDYRELLDTLKVASVRKPFDEIEFFAAVDAALLRLGLTARAP
jgi:CheY-like chemotaxis protein